MVTITLILSDNTFVPPVTDDLSPPASIQRCFAPFTASKVGSTTIILILLSTLAKEFKGDSACDRILKETLEAPIAQILKNAGLDVTKIYTKALKENEGYNVVTGEFGDMFEMGVIDPAKVTIQALSNAISVATTILTTNAIITHARIHTDA